MIGPAVGGVGGSPRFWSTSIFDVIIQIAGILYLQETYAPVLLERKARRMAEAHVISDSIDNSEKGEGAKKSTAGGTGQKHFRTIYDGSADRSMLSPAFKQLAEHH
ncbi:hypothetical protein MPER_04331 [Moniliophthora perniciosa FA553]|nr:hypothetical protein MPER_04331 [Moniliophthora perniciosa FA553]